MINYCKRANLTVKLQDQNPVDLLTLNPVNHSLVNYFNQIQNHNKIYTPEDLLMAYIY